MTTTIKYDTMDYDSEERREVISVARKIIRPQPPEANEEVMNRAKQLFMKLSTNGKIDFLTRLGMKRLDAERMVKEIEH